MEFREILQQEYIERLRKNPKYSMRAYANFLGIDSGSLSRLLNGQRKANSQTMEKLSLRLGINFQEIDEQGVRRSTPKDLSLEIFKIISDWQHFAILELIKTDDFINDTNWIASRLGLQNIEARDAIERLKNVDFIEEDKNGKLILKDIHLSTLSQDYTTAALRKLQKCFLEKAITAQEEVEFDDRHQSTLTVAVARDQLPQIKEKINQFRRSLNDFCEAHKSKDQVYNLSLSLYPLTKIKNEER